MSRSVILVLCGLSIGSLGGCPAVPGGGGTQTGADGAGNADGGAPDDSAGGDGTADGGGDGTTDGGGDGVTDGTDATDDGGAGSAGEVGAVVFALPDGHIYRIRAEEAATAEDLTAALDALAPRGADDWVNISPDGAWLVVSTERFDAECAGFACLAVVPSDLSAFESVRAAGQVVHTEGFGAIAGGGNLIVFPSQEGPNQVDLWAMARTADGWGVAQLITGDSPHPYNTQPAISDDGSRVVFDCSPVPFSQEGTSLCEVGVDGAGYRVVLAPGDPPPGLAAGGALHHADYAPDGSIVFEASWNGERLWRLAPGSSVPTAIGAEFNNDNSPCVLTDGSIASLWLDRPGGTGTHELKVASPDGAEYFILLSQDIVDGGIGCGGGGADTGGGASPEGNGGGASPPVAAAQRYFPAEAVWYQDVSDAAPAADSEAVIAYLDSVGGFGLGRMQIDFSIEVLEAEAGTPSREFTPTEDWYDPDCDLDAVPVPDGGALEGETGYECENDGDCHLIVVDRAASRLYEMWRANIVDGEFFGGCLAVWDMTRVYGPEGRGRDCTSADAAGFPIAPLLFSADEVAAGSIDHAIRFILPNDRIRERVYVAPATHSTGATGGPAAAPPYGARFRLRADFPLDTLPNEGARVVARSLQRFGMLLADAGNVALTAQSDRFTTAKWAGLLESRDLDVIQITDFEMLETGAEQTFTGDCVRE
ncbi:MAG: hypothetical protein HY763_14870 [Planctomycetes bacterium]|nr:hypothetical protein [Planctomycetota bacterium]